MEGSRRAADIPLIRRARGFRLYDNRGRRYLDLYRDGGGALLGHRAGTVHTVMKSVLSQGLAPALPSVWEARLAAMIASLFPAFGTVRLFSSRARALEALGCYLGVTPGPEAVHDMALGTDWPAGARALLWRPLLPDGPLDDGEALLPVLPFTICGAPAPLCLPVQVAGNLPDSDLLPGFLLAGAVRALADLPAAARASSLSTGRVEKAVDSSSGWKRRGPYVRAVFDSSEYPRVFDAFLREGVLLSPGHPGPSILPGECSPGETRLLADLFAGIPGG